MNNITKLGANPCCSCGMCEIACPHNAITLQRNKGGFYAPTIDMTLCTDCGICMKVCYQYLERKDTFKNVFEGKPVYAAWSKNPDTVMTCSSGGVAYELASYFYDKGYKICGVIFDAPNDNCQHIIARTREDLGAIKTSKYLQSYTVEAFSQFKKGEKYLVFGAPCQIYGLRKWLQLKKWEDNFILVDFFCFGIPSFNLWLKYKSYIIRKYQLANHWENVNFRYKNREAKWHKNAILLHDSYGRKYFQIANNDLFFYFFGSGSCLNEACYKCQLRDNYCDSDIRVADFWGEKYESNDEGVSMVIINTLRGEKIWDDIQNLLNTERCNFADLLSQRNLYLSAQKGWKITKRKIILTELRGEMCLEDIYNKYFRPSFFRRKLIFMRKILVFTLKKLLSKSLLTKIKKKIYGR